MDTEYTNSRGYKEMFTIEEYNRGRENARKAARWVVARSPILQEVVAARNAQTVQPAAVVTRKENRTVKSGINLQNDIGVISF